MDELEGHIIVDPSTGIESKPDHLEVVKSVKVIEPMNTNKTDFFIGETIIQQHIDEDDPTIIYTSKGSVTGWDDEEKIIRYIQDSELHADYDGNVYEFTGDVTITGERSKKDVIPDVKVGAGVPVEIGGIQYKDGYSIDQVDKYSGNLLYVTNLSPIERISTQSERVSIIISY